MNWITEAEVEKKSKTQAGAMAITLKHWFQIYMASENDLCTFKTQIIYFYCGMCFYQDVTYYGCILDKTCHGILFAASDLLEDFRINPTRKKHTAFRSMCREVIKELRRIKLQHKLEAPNIPIE